MNQTGWRFLYPGVAFFVLVISPCPTMFGSDEDDAIIILHRMNIILMKVPIATDTAVTTMAFMADKRWIKFNPLNNRLALHITNSILVIELKTIDQFP